MDRMYKYWKINILLYKLKKITILIECDWNRTDEKY